MPRQKTRTNTTLACMSCQWRHERCERLPGENICISCKEHNRLCVSIPGNKRGPKPRRQNLGFANLQPFSNINPYGATQIQHWEQFMPSIGNGSHPVSRASYTQYQLTPSIESYSCLTPEVYTQYQLMPSNECYSYLTPWSNLYQIAWADYIHNQSSSTSFLLNTKNPR
ncbi:17588_t:CDS:1 [Cetraspora pellucida]|uniref:17588_t:CDS:1 n=1 Tax=Cetraspora pellucida TaxID=1433469 RepID=A0A9N9AN97_9GLOM|nr:17588_t:CDS:1 [Cetraspora pellucida]